VGFFLHCIYIISDIIAAVLYPGYDYTSQQVSELSAVGSPSRFFWIIMNIIWTLLVIAFGIGIWKLAGSKLLMRLNSILFIAWGIIGMPTLIEWPDIKKTINLCEELGLSFIELNIKFSYRAIFFKGNQPLIVE